MAPADQREADQQTDRSRHGEVPVPVPLVSLHGWEEHEGREDRQHGGDDAHDLNQAGTHRVLRQHRHRACDQPGAHQEPRACHTGQHRTDQCAEVTPHLRADDDQSDRREPSAGIGGQFSEALFGVAPRRMQFPAQFGSEVGRESPVIHEVGQCAIEAINHDNHPCFKCTPASRWDRWPTEPQR